MRRLPVLSASQTENHVACPRKRYLKSVKKIPEPQSPGAAIGDKVHGHSDKYLNEGIEPRTDEIVEYQNKQGTLVRKNPGRIFQNGRHLLPKPGEAIAEGLFKMRTAAAEWWGARDWVRRAGLEAYGATVLEPWISLLLGDNKTTSNPIYAKNSAELTKDIQANQYAFDIFVNPDTQKSLGLNGPPPYVPVRWVYFLTDENPKAPSPRFATPEQTQKWASWVAAGKPLAWAVEIHLYPAQVAKRVEEIDALAMEMITVAEQAGGDPYKVKPNLNACSDFGGCAYSGTDNCRLTNQDIYGRVFGGADQKPVPDPAQRETAPPVLVTAPGETMSVTPMTSNPVLAAALAAAAAAQANLAAQNPASVSAPPVFAAPPVAAAPAVAPPVAAPAAPRVWAYGDPLNIAQQHMVAGGAALWVVALAAAPEFAAPTPEQAMAWPGAMAQFVPYPVGMTPVAQPERVHVNAPEAPAAAHPNPESQQRAYEAHQAAMGPAPTAQPAPAVTVTETSPGPADTATREGLKELCMRWGAVDPDTGKPIDKSCRLGPEKLRKAYDKAYTAHVNGQLQGMQAPGVAYVQPAPQVVPQPAPVPVVVAPAPVEAAPPVAALPPVAVMAPSLDMTALAQALAPMLADHVAQVLAARLAGGGR